MDDLRPPPPPAPPPAPAPTRAETEALLADFSGRLLHAARTVEARLDVALADLDASRGPLADRLRQVYLDGGLVVDVLDGIAGVRHALALLDAAGGDPAVRAHVCNAVAAAIHGNANN